MDLKDFLAFDVETATQQRSSICQIGYVIVNNLRIVMEYSFLIQPPGNEYSAIQSNLHGLCALDTKNSPSFPALWNKISSDFQSYTLVAHNSDFDTSVLSASLEYYKIHVPKIDCICTYKMTNLKLKSLCESLNVSLEDHHDALSDARAVANSLIKIIQGVDIDESLIHPDKLYNPFNAPGHERLTGDVLKPNLEIADRGNPFYSKKVVFTGVLKSISRKEAADILKNKGADIDTGITKRTKYVIVGSGAGPSKLKKIDSYNQEGADIEVIDEETLLNMIE